MAKNNGLDMNGILVLGYFGFRKDKLDGQTVKTRDLYRLVKEQIADKNVSYYDTEELKFNRFSIFKMFWVVSRCKILVYLPAQNNLKFFFPIIFLLSLISSVKIHYFVVGGWLKEFLSHLPVHRMMLRYIAGIHTETQRMKNELEENYHFKNVDTFPNFRFFDFTPQHTESDKLRLVFMARVMKQKGLDWIFELADYIAINQLQDRFSITFFGQINDDDCEYFKQEVQNYSFVEYKGPLQPSEIHDTLSKYDVMLLPTHFYTEGLPGSVVDAYISGIPVLVTDWKHAHEFVEDGVSGYIVPFENGQQQMIEKVMLLKKDKELLRQLQSNVLVKRMEFAPPNINKILNERD